MAFIMLALAAVTQAGGAPAPAAGNVEYGVASWESTRLGNQRAVVEVAETAEAVWVQVPWRRRDAEPEKKAVWVYDARSGRRVGNALAPQVTRESGTVVFEPVSGPGTYHVYYMPYTTGGEWYFPQVRYVAPDAAPDAGWLVRNGLEEGEQWRALPQARVVRFEACNEFHRRDPMELAATAAEVEGLLKAHAGEAFLVFPEARERPIRMPDALPQRWIEAGPGGKVTGEAQRNEYFTFQLGIYAAHRDLGGLQVRFGDLVARGRHVLPKQSLTCFNLEGTDWLGRPIRREVNVAQGKVQALWCGVQIPAEASPGLYEGTLFVGATAAGECAIPVALRVHGSVLADQGVGDLDRMARLKWLNSTIGLDEEVTAPYTPVEVEGRSASLLGRWVTWNEDGFLDSIRCGDKELLAAPLGMTVETGEGVVKWKGQGARVVREAPGAVAWSARRRAGALKMACRAKLECDGYANFVVTLEAERPTDLEDVRLEVPMRREVATYMMGLGKMGGYRPKEWRWDWSESQPRNMVWLGDVHAGLQCKLKGPNDEWNLGAAEAGAVRNWGNDGKGGCTVTEEGEDTVLLRAFTGARHLAAGERLELRFGLLITPVKPLDPAHWTQRYIHEYTTAPALDEVVTSGANIINIHQGNEWNPYINYPFLTADKLREYITAAHARGLKVKTYYTVRELSNFTKELFALRSLGHEVYTGGGGGGDSWLQEHLVGDYGAAWHQPYPNGEVDAAISTVGLSRWHNYYLEGLSWLVSSVGLDGLYLDGIGYDREIMKRVRKVLDRTRPGCLIDFHSGNDFAYMDRRVSPANLYMEHFPYIDSLWFGEMYDYNLPPDYWLVEVSGIPFGLYGEMLQGGGNPWRGMLYGMTNRLHWQGDPRAIWRVWDDFGIAEAQMLGYWDPGCPVRTGNDQVLATVYRKAGQSLISLASWSAGRVACKLEVNWDALGLDPAKASFYAPAVEGFQPERVYKPGDAIPVAPGRGWLLYVDEEGREPAPQPDVYAGRKLLLEDDFARETPGEAWTVSLSERGEATLGTGEGGLVIRALDNCYAFVERALPAGTDLVQCRVDTGTDAGATWGPGLTLLWSDGRALRVNVRSMGTFGVDDGTDFAFPGSTSAETSYWLRVRLEADKVWVESSTDGEFWDLMQTYPRERFAGSPALVRLGKSGPGGKAEDYHDMARPGTCTLGELRVYGRQG